MDKLTKKLKELREYTTDVSLVYVINELVKIYKQNENLPYQNIFYSAQDTMSFMLEYYSKQLLDPQRVVIFTRLRNDILFVIDALIEYQKGVYEKNMTSIYWSYSLKKKLLENLNILNVSEINKNELFMSVWMTDNFNKATQEAINKYLSNDEVPQNEKVVLVSAISLSLWRIYDNEKMKMVISLCTHENDEISSRAIVALLISIFLYEKRIKIDNEIKNKIFELLNDEEISELLDFSMLQHIKTLKTEDIIKEFQSEILPEMMKFQSEFKNIDMLNIEDLQDMMDDENPGWNDEKNSNMEFLEKMEEFTMQQFEGADIYSPTLGKMKNFSFFNDISNWLKPFSAEIPEVVNSFSSLDPEVRDEFVSIIAQSNMFCDSDKYSFCFHFSELPSMLQENVAKIMIEQLSTADELGQANYNKQDKMRPLIVRYFQDLYRFFNFNSIKTGFENIFDSKFGIHNNEFFEESDAFVNILKNGAELYMKQKMYLPAALTFEKILKKTSNIEILEKAGYCYQKIKLYNRALDFYTKAELIEGTKKWLVKKLAFCNMKLKKYDKAIEYYKVAEQLAQEDISIQVNFGACYIYTEQYDEALKCFFKADYYKPDNIRNLRSIAFCYFKTGKYDEAVKYAEKCIAKEGDKVDFFIVGSIKWINDDFKEAFEYYLTAMNFYKNILKFFEDFKEYFDFLRNNKINDIDISLMTELLIKKWTEQ